LKDWAELISIPAVVSYVMPPLPGPHPSFIPGGEAGTFAPSSPMPIQSCNSVQYVGLGTRFFAGLVDCAILFIPSLLFNGTFSIIIIYWIYESLLTSSPWQATLGMKAMKIQITDTRGRRISFGRASARYFASLLSAFLLMIGYLMILFSPKKQSFHDLIAGTLVLKLPVAAFPDQTTCNLTNAAHTAEEGRTIIAVDQRRLSRFKTPQTRLICGILIFSSITLLLGWDVWFEWSKFYEGNKLVQQIPFGQGNPFSDNTRNQMSQLYGNQPVSFLSWVFGHGYVPECAIFGLFAFFDSCLIYGLVLVIKHGDSCEKPAST
jgi:uncharacterized RDD family membrane protein YckC